MSEVRISGVTTDDVRAMVRVATAVARGRALRFPVEMQLRSLAITALELHDILERCLNGEADAIATARMIVEDGL